MSGAFDTSSFLSGYYDDDCYFNIPTHYLPNMNDPWYLDQYRRNKYILATGVHDQCWNANESIAHIFRAKNIPCQLDVWGDDTGHDWPWWLRMLQTYL
jgi:esterase/lipase superfamily enzyme